VSIVSICDKAYTVNNKPKPIKSETKFTHIIADVGRHPSHHCKIFSHAMKYQSSISENQQT
jgi:hypothetical protein